MEVKRLNLSSRQRISASGIAHICTCGEILEQNIKQFPQMLWS